MRAVVLVGGFGTRLRPLTNRTPKPMLPVGQRPIIEGVAVQLVRGGVTEVVLALGFQPEPFADAFPDGTVAGVPLRFAVEPEPLDTAGAIRFAALSAGINDTFVVVNGDVLTDLDVSELVRFHRRSGAEASLHLTPVDDPSAFGVVEIDPGGRVRRFVEKPAPGTTSSNLVNAGTYVCEPSMLDRIPSGRKVSVERETFPALVAEGRLFAMPTDDYWIDTGQPAPYLRANLDVLDGKRRWLSCRAIAASAQVSPDAVVHHSLVGEGAWIGAAAISDSVVLPGAHVSDGARVERSCVAGRIGRGAVVVDSVVGAEGTVADGATLLAGRLPEPA